MNPANLFFLVGPLRTGSSLMARCIDDHPDAMCLCESEINRALFPEYFVRLHFQRMEAHGMAAADTATLLDGKKQDDIPSLLNWYSEVHRRIGELFKKPANVPLGDKSPDFFCSAALVEHLAANFQLIYTVRDPRAVFHSIDVQTDAPPRQKVTRWQNLFANFSAWEPFLDRPNILVVRYEDFVARPEETMAAVYGHLDLSTSGRFLESFPRLYPQRFLWKTAIDWSTGVRKAFDPSRANRWQASLTSEHLGFIRSTPQFKRFIRHFQYEG